MTPPPRFGLFRSKDEFHFEPALDDAPLVAAKASLARGRWTEVRDLLARTGDDWDRRGHRVMVLAETPSALTWAEEWRLAEPDSADAATLLASAYVFKAVTARSGRPPGNGTDLDRARQHCLTAAQMAPADPTPWLALLVLARHAGTADEQSRAFDQVRGRHQDHHHAHHLMAACLADRPAHDGDSLFHEVYEFAEWAASVAPYGSPLAALPLVAHAERFRVLAAGTHPQAPMRKAHWQTWRARQGLKNAFDWWLDWDGRDHPRLYVDLNHLVYAQVAQDRTAEAAALFNRIGSYATREPWSYPDRDPAKAFLTARGETLGPPP